MTGAGVSPSLLLLLRDVAHCDPKLVSSLDVNVLLAAANPHDNSPGFEPPQVFPSKGDGMA